MTEADLRWLANRGRITLVDEYRVRPMLVDDVLAQRVRVGRGPTDFVSMRLLAAAIAAPLPDPLFEAWRAAAHARLAQLAAPACPVTGDPADICDHIDLEQVDLGGEG